MGHLFPEWSGSSAGARETRASPQIIYCYRLPEGWRATGHVTHE